ncbi:RHS repeat-associated core domain-containing protein [Chloroflexota bacterium]
MGRVVNRFQRPGISAVWFGETRSSTGTLDTDKLFTGQRLDQTGLYFYNARYYDATIGRFISADSIVPEPFNPQSLNRYSYCLNNPLRYIDPSGHGYQEDGSFIPETSSELNQFAFECSYYMQTGRYYNPVVSSVVFGNYHVIPHIMAGVVGPIKQNSVSSPDPADEIVNDSGWYREGECKSGHCTGSLGLKKRNPENGFEAEAFHLEGSIGITGMYVEGNMLEYDFPIVNNLIGDEDLTVGLVAPGGAASYSFITGRPSYGGHLVGGNMDIGDAVGGTVYIGLYTPYVGYNSETKQVTGRIGPLEIRLKNPF